MSTNKRVATGLLVVGILILLVSALADVVGIGGSPNVLGYRQITGIGVGAVLAIVGVILYWWVGREA